MERRDAVRKALIGAGAVVAAPTVAFAKPARERVGYLEYQDNGVPWHGSTDPHSMYFDPYHAGVQLRLNGEDPRDWSIVEYDAGAGWILAMPKSGGPLRRVYGVVEAFR